MATSLKIRSPWRQQHGLSCKTLFGKVWIKQNSLAQSQKKIAVGNSHIKWKKKKKRLLALFQRSQTISITGVSKGDGLAQGLGLAPSILPSSWPYLVTEWIMICLLWPTACLLLGTAWVESGEGRAVLSTDVITSHISITHMHFLHSFQKCNFCFSLVFKSSLFSLHLKFKSLNTFFKVDERGG